MNTYAAHAKRTPLEPSVRSAMVTMDAFVSPVFRITSRFTSSTSSPVPSMYAQHSTRAVVLGTKPLLWHTAGSASMPAPTVVPATSAIAPGSEPGSGASAPESSGATFDQRRADSSLVSGGGEDESPAATPGGRFLGATDDSTPVAASSPAVTRSRGDHPLLRTPRTRPARCRW